jgi:ABC-type transport system involved in multi-copper enzyme maturation permease subunit
VKLREIFRYEVQHRLRSSMTWIFAVVLLLLAFVMVHFDADGSSATHVNAPSRLALLSVMAGMIGMLASAAFFGDAGLRDHEAGMDPLLFTSPLRKIDYLGGRFLGALAVNALILVGIPLGSAIATQMPYLERTAFGPFDIWPFVQNYLLFLLPNLIMTGALLFAIAVLTRGTIPVYLGAIGIFVGYVIAVNLSSENAIVAVLTDPFGIRVMNNLTARWTPVERNSRLLASSAGLLTNRAVWLGIAAVVLAVLHRRFRFAYSALSTWRKPSVVLKDVVVLSEAKDLLVVNESRSFATFTPIGVEGLRTTGRQFIAIARRGLAEAVASPAFILLFVAKIGLTIIMGWDAGEGVFDTSTTPLTVLIYERLTQTPLVAITYLLVALYAGELVWKNRDTGMAEIADAAPVSEATELGARFAALVAIIAILQVPVLIGGMIAQTGQGYFNYELGLYFRIFFGMQLADLVLVAALAMLIHVVVNQKYVGHLLVLLAFITRAILGGINWIEHHLLLYGTDPGWKYSNMNGFGPFLRPLVWFKLYWGAWAMVLLIVAALFWVRGRETGARMRFALARARFSGSLARALAVASVLILMLGGFVFYNTNVVNEYQTTRTRGAREAMYERRYRRFLNAPQPTLVDASLRIELYPGESRADLGGTYRLVNRAAAPIDSVHILVADPVVVRSMSVDRPARAMIDDETGYRIYALERPLRPGDSLTVTFDATLQHRGFGNDASSTVVVDNGSWITRRYLPLVGYQPELELISGRERVGLGERPPLPAAADPGNARNYQQVRNDADLVHALVTIGTSDDQTAFTAGQLRRTWTENNRRYFQYETVPPNSVAGGYFSARYAVKEDRWNGVTLRVLHDPREGDNVDRMMRSMKASLAYYTSQFGAYPDSELSVVEAPRYSVFGVALPTAMAFSEDAFHSQVKEGQIDQPFYGAAHETAHHWWGGMANPAPVRGAGLLSESLANYSAMMVMEKAFGRDVAQRVYKFQMDRYFSGRAEYSREVPLIDVGGQSYLNYRKGAVAMYTMRDMIGEKAVNTALHRYADRFRRAGPPYPTSLDLVAELRAVTPDSLKSLIGDLFETVTLWEVKADSATVARMPNGKYQVALAVDVRKLRADSVGRQTEIPMNDLVEIGVFAEGKQSTLGEPLYLERQRLRSGKQIIHVIVDKEPTRAAIDPYDKTIDRERGDNVRELTRIP